MISDELVQLLVAMEEAEVIARGMDAAGYAYTLQGLSALEEAGWKFVPPPKDGNGS